MRSCVTRSKHRILSVPWLMFWKGKFWSHLCYGAGRHLSLRPVGEIVTWAPVCCNLNLHVAQMSPATWHWLAWHHYCGITMIFHFGHLLCYWASRCVQDKGNSESASLQIVALVGDDLTLGVMMREFWAAVASLVKHLRFPLRKPCANDALGQEATLIFH